LDELPQLFSILKGDITFVGPRPALYTQGDLIALRTEKGVHTLVPGLTGWAQVNGRDNLTIPAKVGLDEYYLYHRSAFLDLKIVLLTLIKVVRYEGVKH
jgi:O-antigen biosynthesis protein WbqP